MGQVIYFAYGSNLSTRQMRARCATARVDARAVLCNHALAFGGFSVRWGGAVATLVPSLGAQVEGLLYVLRPADLRSLDRHEGHPWVYRRARFAVTDENGRRVCAQVYVQALPNLEPGSPAPRYAGVLRRAYKRLGFDASRLTTTSEVVP
jgi:cation transport regulator ChaC